MKLCVAVFALTIPLGLDLYVPVPEENPLTVEKIELGRGLFNDRRLSSDGSIACVSCHDPARAFSDGRAIAVGVFGRSGRRNAPAIVNRGYGRAFFWDGRAPTLEEQVLKPIEDPNEMDLSIDDAATRVGLSPDELSRALASYVRSILSGDSGTITIDKMSPDGTVVLETEGQFSVEGTRDARGPGVAADFKKHPTT